MNRTLSILAWLIVTVVITIRPLMAESYSTVESGMTTALRDFDDPSPLYTIGFNVAIILAYGLSLVADRRTAKSTPARTGLERAYPWLVAVVALSSFLALHQRVAIDAGLDWLCYPVLAMTIARLARTPDRRAVLVSLLIASGGVQAWRCLYQVNVGFPETWRFYQENREAFWSSQGVELDSERVELFERRMLAREASGTLPHSNVTGSHLLIIAMLLLGMIDPRYPGRAVAVALMLLIVLAALWHTGSTGAWMSLAVGVVLAVAALKASAFGVGSRRLRQGALAACALAAVLVTTYGLATDSLPGASLNFRWHYWRVASSIVAEHPVIGTGRENFRDWFLRHKPIDVPEEVANPHNALVQFTTDFGIPGAVIFVAMLLGASRIGLRPPRDEIPTQPVTRLVVAAAIPGAVAFALRWGMMGTADFNFLYFTTVTDGLAWCLFLLPAVAVLSAVDPKRWSLAAGCALAAFLVHDMINFALFVPGTATVFFATLGLVAAGREAEQPDDAPATTAEQTPPRSRAAGYALPAAAFAIGLGAAIFLAALPVARAAWQIEKAGRITTAGPVSQSSVYLADQAFQDATAADPWDDTIPETRSRWWLTVSEQLGARNAISEACLRLAVESVNGKPNTLDRASSRAAALRALAAFTRNVEDYHAAASAADDVIAFYPTDPDRHIDAGDAWLALALADTSNAAPAADRAVTHYRRALALDDARPEWERIRGLSPRRREEVQSHTTEAESLATKK